MTAEKVFTISGKEVENFEDWLEEHDKSCRFAESKMPKNGIPPLGWARFTYMFSPTSMGFTIKVKCQCGEEVDITDFDSW